MRVFTKTPQGSPFAVELCKIIDYYVLKSIKTKATAHQSPVYDFHLFNKLVPYSVLAAELQQLFAQLPHQAFDAVGEPQSSEASMAGSCMWPTKSAKDRDLTEIRKY